MDSKPVQLEHVSADSVTTAVRQPMKAEESVVDSKSIKLEPANDNTNVDVSLARIELAADAAPITPIDNQPAQRRRNTKPARISVQRAAARILNAAAEIHTRNTRAAALNLAAIAAARPREMRAAARTQRAAARDEAATIAQPRRGSQAIRWGDRPAPHCRPQMHQRPLVPPLIRARLRRIARATLKLLEERDGGAAVQAGQCRGSVAAEMQILC